MTRQEYTTNTINRAITTLPQGLIYNEQLRSIIESIVCALADNQFDLIERLQTHESINKLPVNMIGIPEDII